MNRQVDIGIVTDEISRDLAESLEIAQAWGLSHFELREGGEDRFPNFTRKEVGLVDDLVRSGGHITAVSPGILKGSVADRPTIRREIDDVLPRSIELAKRFECPLLIVFGFERRAHDDENRTLALDVLTEVAEIVAAAELTAAVENEPNFWIDKPSSSAEMLAEIGHSDLRLNWDPANLHWGGTLPDYDGFHALRPYISNVHVKDFYPDDPDAPWRPVGAGATPWERMLPWIIDETNLGHVTIETHCEPLVESSRRSVDNVRRMISEYARPKKSMNPRRRSS